MRPDPRVWPPLVVALAVAGPPLLDGKADWAWADAPRHLMNGVFLHDALRDLPRVLDQGVSTFAERYYAQYPALSLGHHPPLTAVALVPALIVLGPTLFAAQFTMLAIFVLATALLYSIVCRQFGRDVAMWSTLLFASHPFVAGFARTTMSEMPALAMVFLTMLAALRFRDSGRGRDFVLLVIAALATLLTRQTAIFVWPAYAWIAWGASPEPRARRAIAMGAAAAVAGVAALAVATIWYSPFNVDVALDVLRRPRVSTWVESSRAIALGLARWPLLLAVAAAVGVAVVRRVRRGYDGNRQGFLADPPDDGDRRGRCAVPPYDGNPEGRFAVPPYDGNREGRFADPSYGGVAIWVGSVLAGAILVTGAIEAARYAILALPAFCIVAASLAGGGRYRMVAAGVLGVVVAAQCWATATAAPQRTDAYERAAAYVVDRIGDSRATVLYSASADTGYFVFFVRALDPHGAIVTLRADKLLTTSMMTRASVRDRVASASEMYPLLERYATRFVVVESGATGSAILDEGLPRELAGRAFVERVRLPVEGWRGRAADPPYGGRVADPPYGGRVADPPYGGRAADPPYGGRSVVVYEFLDAAPQPAADAELDLELPLVNRQIRVRLADLQRR